MSYRDRDLHGCSRRAKLYAMKEYLRSHHQDCFSCVDEDELAIKREKLEKLLPAGTHRIY